MNSKTFFWAFRSAAACSFEVPLSSVSMGDLVSAMREVVAALSTPRAGQDGRWTLKKVFLRWSPSQQYQKHVFLNPKEQTELVLEAFTVFCYHVNLPLLQLSGSGRGHPRRLAGDSPRLALADETTPPRNTTCFGRPTLCVSHQALGSYHL